MVESRNTLLHDKVKWLILIRMLLATVFFSVGHFIFEVEKTHFYIIIAFVYLMSLLYSLWLVKRRGIKVLVSVQVIIDVLLETLIIQLTGGIESVFTILYVLSIISAGVIVSGAVGIMTAVFIGIAYVGSNVMCSLNMIPIAGICALQEHALNVTLYTSYVHVVTFVLISILLSQLMNRITRMEQTMRLKEHLALVGEVSSEIAHEIRNPLTSISGSVELLDERLVDRLSKEEKKLMGAIVDETDRVSRIFDQFLDYAKLSKSDFKKLNMCDVLDDVLFMFGHNKRVATNVNIIREFDPDKIMVLCDPHKIKQVFTNIINNAIQVMNDGGELRITMNVHNRQVVVSFKDSGPGMKPEIVKKLFTPFESSTEHGLGLGLTISSKIVEMHGGKIDVNTKLGEGSTFHVSIPLA